MLSAIDAFCLSSKYEYLKPSSFGDLTNFVKNESVV